MENFEELKNELKALYPGDYETKHYDELFNGELLESSSNYLRIQKLIRSGRAAKLLNDLNLCDDNPADWKKFQDFCFDLVKTTIEKNEFTKVPTLSELRTIYDVPGVSGQRKDIVIANNSKDQSDSCVWRRLYNEYMCRILVFDAKYYSTELSAETIFQMYSYLDPNERRIGFILSKTGQCSREAKAALRRIKKDNYHIIIFSIDDMKEWLKEYSDDGTIEKTFFKKYTELNTEYSP